MGECKILRKTVVFYVFVVYGKNRHRVKNKLLNFIIISLVNIHRGSYFVIFFFILSCIFVQTLISLLHLSTFIFHLFTFLH